jgi:hypothetical protein
MWFRIAIECKIWRFGYSSQEGKISFRQRCSIIMRHSFLQFPRAFSPNRERSKSEIRVLAVNMLLVPYNYISIRSISLVPKRENTCFLSMCIRGSYNSETPCIKVQISHTSNYKIENLIIECESRADMNIFCVLIVQYIICFFRNGILFDKWNNDVIYIFFCSFFIYY